MSQQQDIINDKSKVMIFDSVGILAKIYSMLISRCWRWNGQNGLHNTLEPAVFKIIVIIGIILINLTKLKNL